MLLNSLSCATCHTRVQPDGTVLKDAQGNFPSDAATAWTIRHSPDFPEPAVRAITGILFDAPFVPHDPNGQLSQQPTADIVRAYAALPSGTEGRQGTSLLYPPAVPDLIGVRDRLYLDHGGLARHRSLGDMMRYIAVNQALDFLASYDGYISASRDHRTLPPPGKSRFVGHLRPLQRGPALCPGQDTCTPCARPLTPTGPQPRPGAAASCSWSRAA